MGEEMKFDLTQIGSDIKAFIEQDIETIARDTKFVQRDSDVNGQVFLQSTVFGFIENPDASLGDLAQVCQDLKVKISSQGFDQRINKEAVAFLKQIFVKALDQFKSRIRLPLPLLEQFTAVNLTDSSVIALPDNMAQEYAGCGGDGPQASLKIQLVFDFLLGNLAQVALRAGRESDQGYRDYIQVLEKGALSITDLGYFCLDAFKAIMYEQEAYFVSRFLIGTGLLTRAGEAIDLLKLVQSCPREPFEIDVLMGKQRKHHLPCRLIVLPVPQEVADQRRRKAKETAQRKGRTVSKERLALMSWTFLVTNVPTERLSIEHVALLYRVRWQVELVFKLWKSYCGLERVIGLRRERVLVELYAKMIGIVLTHFLTAPFRMPKGTLANREISPVKVRNIFKRFARDLNRSLGALTKLCSVLKEMVTHIERFGFKEKRNKEPNVCHALALASAMCGLDIDLGESLP
jgi:hypothetical protein